MAAWRWETFREIADPYHCQSIKRRHTWRPILLPHPYLDPQSPTPPSTTPLTPSSPPPPKSRPQTAPQAPGASRESPAVRDLVSHSCALARCAQSQRRWDTGSRSGPAHCRVHISGASRPGGALTCLNSLLDLPAAANIFTGFAQHGICWKHLPHYGLPRYAP